MKTAELEGALGLLKAELAEAKAELERIQKLPRLSWAQMNARLMQELAKLSRAGQRDVAMRIVAMVDEAKTYQSMVEAELAKEQLDAARYRLAREVMFDHDFDAYDAEGLDAELDRRLALIGEQTWI